MINRFFFCALILFAFSACNKSQPSATGKIKLDDSKPSVVKPIEVPAINYGSVPTKSLVFDTSDARMSVVLALNRVDYEHLLRMDSIIVPDSFYANQLWYSPFPQSLEFIKDVKRIIFYSYRVEAFGAYENGRLVRWGPVSMGKKSTPTPTGLFHTTWKSKKTTSTVDDDWIMEWYFNLENRLGVSMHQYELPGYPASHACVRLSKEDAMWFYNWCQQWILKDKGKGIQAYGTPVVIFGEYAFGKTKPWKQLTQNKTATEITDAELKSVTEEFMPLIIQRQMQRDSLVGSSVI